MTIRSRLRKVAISKSPPDLGLPVLGQKPTLDNHFSSFQAACRTPQQLALAVLSVPSGLCMPLPPGSLSDFGSRASPELRWLLVSSAFSPVYPSVRLRAPSEQTGVCVTGLSQGYVPGVCTTHTCSTLRRQARGGSWAPGPGGATRGAPLQRTLEGGTGTQEQSPRGV